MHLIWSSPTENLNGMWQYMLILQGLYFLLACVISDLSCLQSQFNLLQPWLLAEPESNSQHVFATPIEVKQYRAAIWKVNFAFFVIEALLSCRSVTNQHWLTFCQDQVSELLYFTWDSLRWENFHVFPGADLPLALYQ